jgi:uncharacterized membrane protein YbhN (UPF0104 family)
VSGTVDGGMPGPRRAARRLAKVAVSVAAVAFLLREVDLRSVGAAFRQVRLPLVVLAFGLYLGGQILSAGRWAVIARAVGFRRSLTDYVTFYYIGMFLNLFGPSTIGGDVARGLYLGRGGQRARALNSVVFDRASGLAVLVGVGVLAVLAFPRYRLPPALPAAAAALGVALVLCWWLLPRVLALALAPTHRLRRFVEHDLAPFWRDRALLGQVVLASAAFHLSQVAVQYTLAAALGLGVPFSYCLIFHPAVSVVASLPVSVAGIGVREAGYLFFLAPVGVAEGAAVTFGLLWFALAVAGGLVGGAVLALRGAGPGDPGARQVADETASIGRRP